MAKEPQKTRKAATGGARKASKPKEPSLQDELRDYASARPAGWSHDDWLNFLEYLRERGHDTGDADRIGRLLERERLAAVLREVQGVGPRRVEAIVERFGSVWDLRQADAESIAQTPGIPRALAERIKESVG